MFTITPELALGGVKRKLWITESHCHQPKVPSTQILKWSFQTIWDLRASRDLLSATQAVEWLYVFIAFLCFVLLQSPHLLLLFRRLLQ